MVELTVKNLAKRYCEICGGLTSIRRKFSSHSASNASLASNVRVQADLVWGTTVIDTRCLDQDLDVDLAHVLRHTEEASGEVLSRLHHAVLTLCPEHRQLTLSGEVVEQVSVQLPVLHTKQKVLATTERCKEFGA